MQHSLLEPVLDARAMREADRRTIAEAGVTGRVLMESAGHAVCDACESVFGTLAGRDLVVLCGTGNNGGDGFVIARVAHARGGRVRVVVAGTPASEDAAANHAALEALVDERLTIHQGSDARVLSNTRADVVVDAMLGTGQAPDARNDAWLRDPIRAFCSWINRQDVPVVAVDLPTGLDANTGAADRDAVRATLTITLGGLKQGLLIGDGPSLSGEIMVAEIGIPAAVLEDLATAWRATDGWVAGRLPPRGPRAHKYEVGRVTLVAGSRAFTGAAALAAGAAYRAGAGAVVCCTPRSAQPVIDGLRPEVMVAAQFETDDGTLAIAAYDEIVERLGTADSILIGCGLGRPPETQRLVRALLRRAFVPTVLDADGLNAFEGHAEKLAEAHAPVVLTPHAGELERLLGETAPLDPIAAVRELSARWNAVLVLKGMPSVVGASDGRVFIGPPPDTALATAGTGDVLAGTIAGLLARGMAPLDAAVAALHIGTAAAQLFAVTRGPGMMAGDLLDEMPSVMRERFATS